MRRCRPRHVGEQLVQLDILLRACADQVVVRHAGDREHGLSVQLRVVEAIEQMDAARARGGQAHAELAGELRVAARHERGGLFMPDLHEADRVCARFAAPP